MRWRLEAEPLLLAASISAVLSYSTLGQVEPGTRVAWTGFAVYGVGAILSDARRLRLHTRRRAAAST